MALLLLILGAAVPAFTQSAGATADGDTLRPRIKRNIDDRVLRLTKTLELDQTQQSAVKKILEQRLQQIGWIRRDPSISGGARIERFRALQERTVEQIRAVLNDEQKKKYDPLAVRRLQPAPEQRSVEDWLEATTPH
jgi:parvulin-like peptidyl-prolyl isomerase